MEKFKTEQSEEGQRQVINTLSQEISELRDANLRIIKRFFSVKEIYSSVFLLSSDAPGLEQFICKFNLEDDSELTEKFQIERKAVELITTNNVPGSRLVLPEYSSNRFLLLSYVDGEPANSFLKQASNKQDVFSAMGRVAAKLHSIKLDHFGSLVGSENENWRERVSKKWRHGISRVSELVTDVLQSKVQEYAQKVGPYIEMEDSSNPRLIQRDMHLGNFIVSPSGEVNIIDFGMALGGRPLYDFAKIYLDLTKNPECRNAFVAGYQEIMPPQNDETRLLEFYIFIELMGLIPYLAKRPEYFKEDLDYSIILLGDLVESKGKLFDLLK